MGKVCGTIGIVLGQKKIGCLQMYSFLTSVRYNVRLWALLSVA